MPGQSTTHDDSANSQTNSHEKAEVDFLVGFDENDPSDPHVRISFPAYIAALILF